MVLKKKNECGICSKPRPGYVMNNKLVCMRCDELLFDIEIECEEEPVVADKAGTKRPNQPTTIALKK